MVGSRGGAGRDGGEGGGLVEKKKTHAAIERCAESAVQFVQSGLSYPSSFAAGVRGSLCFCHALALVFSS